jgi:alkyl sulfatase BDS1-like metallo-beta-lactamase superfamily hydrolase
VLRRRLLDPPAASVVYELTETGRELGRATVPLARWGARHFTSAARAPEESYRAEWWLVFLADSLNAQGRHERSAEYEFRVDGSVARLRIAEGHAEVLPGEGVSPADAVVRSDAATVAALIGERTTIAEAVAAGRVQADGEPESLASLLELLDSQLRSIVGGVGESS